MRTLVPVRSGTALLLLLSACAQVVPPVPALSPVLTEPPDFSQQAAGPEPPPLPPPLSSAQADAELLRLRAAFADEVPRAIPPDSGSDKLWIEGAREAFTGSTKTIDRPQLLVVVDSNPRVQELRIIMARPEDPWQVIGGSKVSTGQAGRRDYYITPTGVFPHADDILDYRAEGTFNDNHIRGLGLKGMRVWDFGWQSAVKGWRADKESGEIRLLMHATDPDYLEQRLGRRASEGCVRVPAAVDRFMDRHGVLDFEYERAAVEDIRFRALLLPNRTPTPLAGDALVIIDSSPRS
jgi:hypothetical protein